MALLAVGGAFPHLALEPPGGGAFELASAWSQGEALMLVGHGGCRTTRQTLPYVEAIHRRGPGRGRVLAILQDTPADALELIGELGLTLNVLCEPEPYPLSCALGVEVVPSLLLVGADGRVSATCEAFRKAELDAFAARLGVSSSLFAPDDPLPALKPG